ncbi:hypothetical protein HRbin28_01719 [bacterium HR28]|nr:hypothetical protein HRbin28_01719 [bacterium HR28]
MHSRHGRRRVHQFTVPAAPPAITTPVHHPASRFLRLHIFLPLPHLMHRTPTQATPCVTVYPPPVEHWPSSLIPARHHLLSSSTPPT